MIRISRAVPVLMLCIMAVPQTMAATLRTHGILRGPTVRLSDLFDDLRPGQDCDIGPSPAPGKPILIPATQLAAIADQFQVDWHGSNGYETASLERPARQVRRDEIIAAITSALIADGMPPADLVNLGVIANLTLPADLKTAPEIGSLDYDPQTGRFAALVQFSTTDGDPQTIRIAGRVDQSVSILTPTHTIQAGSPLAAVDVTITLIPKATLRGAVLTELSQADGLVSRQTLMAGAPIPQNALFRPLLVTRGRPVVLRLTDDGLALTVSGIALEGGGSGDRIHVLNTSSHAVLVGRVVDGANILIDPGTAPVFTSQPGSGGLPQIASGLPSDVAGPGNAAQEARYP